MPENQGSRFITQEELERLNNPPLINGGRGVPHGWQPLPALNSARQRSDYYNTQSYRQSPSGSRYESGRKAEPGTDQNDWNQPPVVLPVLPVDPMDPGRFGTPYNGPFNGIDSYMYE